MGLKVIHTYDQPFLHADRGNGGFIDGPGHEKDVYKRQHLMGQALFWIAWDYFDKVNTVGGVPLILEVQNIADVPSLFCLLYTSRCV